MASGPATGDNDRMSLRSRLLAMERQSARVAVIARCPDCLHHADPESPRLILVGRQIAEATRCESCGAWRTADGRTSTSAVILVQTCGDPPQLPEEVRELEGLRRKAEGFEG